MDVAAWLRELGLERYEPVFREHEIDWDVLAELTEADLEQLGLPLGPRRKLLKAIVGFSAQPAGSLTVEAPPSPEPVAHEAERRQLTVFFCDLVGSTELATRLDPEDMRDLIRAYQNAVAGEVARFAGYVAKFLGDGVMAYFGWPRAQEDAAERAVRAGLATIEAVGRLVGPGGVSLSCRIGIATGLVVVGDLVGEGAAREEAVVGETPNLAARLQGFARSRQVVIGHSTRRLLGETFELEDLGRTALKGFAEPARVWRVVGASGAESRFDALRGTGLAPVIGREEEIGLLLRRFAQARSGEGQVVLLSGEPGLGKSRLVRALRERLSDAPHTHLSYYGSPLLAQSPLQPVIRQLERAAGFHRDDTNDASLGKLEALLAEGAACLDETMPLIAGLLGLDPGERWPRPSLTPQRRKQRTFEILLEQLAGLARKWPVLIVWEDVQWVDPTSLELVARTIERAERLPIFLVITFRPEFRPSWSARAHVTQLSLTRLTHQDVATIVARVTGGKTLPPDVLEQIVARTDGVPLFVEELTTTVIEAGFLREVDGRYVLDQPLPTLSIPATLHDSLLARLDRLAPAKEVAQIAACIGRDFSLDLLAALSPLARRDLEAALEQLVDAQLVFRRSLADSPGFQFKHALVRDAAYESLLVSRRRRLHARIAKTLEERFPETIATEPERLAQHYTAADMPPEAIRHWLAAGRRALSSSSLREAMSHLSKALELTARIDGAHERAELELEVRTALGAATMALHGWPSREMREVVEPACALFERGHGQSRAFMNLWNLWLHHGCRAEHRKGLAVVEQMLKHAGAREDPVVSLVASFTAAMANLWVGNYAQALTHEAAALEIYDFERDRKLVEDYNHDPRTTLLSWASIRLWALGYPDQARARSDEAVAHARRVGHPFELCWVLGNSSFAYGSSGDYETVRERVSELCRVAQEQELVFIREYQAPASLSVAAAQAGHYETAVNEGVRAEKIWRSVGGRFWSPIVKASMAKACMHLGRHAEAVTLIEEALEQLASTNELMFAAEIYRIAGMIRLERNRESDGAVSFFEKALDIAREQGARSYELRTSICLARLWCQQGKQREARELLTSIYSLFTEGFDTADLKEARVLLEELARPARSG